MEVVRRGSWEDELTVLTTIPSCNLGTAFFKALGPQTSLGPPQYRGWNVL